MWFGLKLTIVFDSLRSLRASKMSVPVALVDVSPTKCYSGSNIVHPHTVDVTFDYMILVRHIQSDRIELVTFSQI